MNLRSSRVFLAFTVAFATLSNIEATPNIEAAPELKFKKIKVNGIDTYLIDTKRGNAMALTVNVQVGSWHDDPVKHAGRAHLWEHTIFLGSKQHPGHHDFDNLAPKVGGMHNAYTSNDRTFYFFNQHPSSLPLSTSLLGGMISEPIWNNEAFLKERDNVKNEALDYQNRDGDAIFDMPFIHLSPKGHPFAMFHVGTQEQLNAMGLDELRSLYNSFYRPEYMQIVVAGNFDPAVTGVDRLDEAKLIELLQKNFKLSSLAHKPTEFKREIPPIVPTDPEAPRMIEIRTASEQKILFLRFQATDFAHANPFLAETVVDSLNINTKGALTRILKDRGLITGGGFSLDRINNLTQVTSYFELTHEGAKKRDLVMQIIFEALGNLTKTGLSPEVFEYLKLRNISSYREMIQTPYKAAEHFAKFLDMPISADLAFDFGAQYGGLNASDVRPMADSLFSPQRMIGAYMGADVAGEEKCPVFGRDLTKLPVSKSLTAWQSWYEAKRPALSSDESQITLKTVPLEFSEKPQGKGQSKPAEVISGETKNTEMILQEDHTSNTAALRAIFLLPRVIGEDSMARSIFVMAFQDQYESELGYLDSLNLIRGVSAGSYELEISVKGNSKASQQALLWLLEKLKNFKPTQDQVERARRSSINRIVSSLDGFTAHTTYGGASAVLSDIGVLPQEKIRILKKLTKTRVKAAGAKLFDRADIILAASGDMTPSMIEDLALRLRAEIPKALSASERAKHDRWATPIRKRTLVWAPLGDSKAEDSLGHVRVFDGPKIGTDDALLFPTFASAFGNAVYRLNRSERKLGYVHNAHSTPYDTHLKFSLVGQTDGKDNFPKIEAGWKELIDQVKDGSFSRQHLIDTIEGRILTLLLKPSTQSEEVDRLVTNYRKYQDLEIRERELEALQKATPEDLLRVGKKYLTSKTFLEVIGAKSKPCKEAISSIANARRKLKKA